MKQIKSPIRLFALSCLIVFIFSCNDESENNTGDKIITNSLYVADYSVAKETILRKIPQVFIDKAREELHVGYQHTSHGTHVSYGLFGLPDYKTGDDVKFAITNNNPTEGKLDFHDNAMSGYSAEGENAVDLSASETAFIQATRNYLDASENADINVVMWSWCDISGHDVSGNYLPGMEALIKEYGAGGSKIGSGAGQRLNPVTFIFMTGHGTTNSNIGDGRPKNQADLITTFCESHQQFCLDYYSIDTHCMNDNYWDDSGDNGNSETYGGNFYDDFQDAGGVGTTYYENKTRPGGDVTFGQHNTQHITANRKAYAMWWILARISGWDGHSAE